MFAYQFVMPDKVLEFGYSDTVSFHVLYGYKDGLYSSDAYVQTRDLFIKPEIKNFPLIIKNANHIETKMNWDGSILKVSEKHLDNNGKFDFQEASCYKTNKKHSFLWYINFSLKYLKETKCKD